MAIVTWKTLDATPEEVEFYRHRLERACEYAFKQNYGIDCKVELIRPEKIEREGTIIVDVK